MWGKLSVTVVLTLTCLNAVNNEIVTLAIVTVLAMVGVIKFIALTGERW